MMQLIITISIIHIYFIYYFFSLQFIYIQYVIKLQLILDKECDLKFKYNNY